MAKIHKNKALDQMHEEDIWSDEWEDCVYRSQQNDWSDYDKHPWVWYMEKSIRIGEGWHLVKISPDHKDVTVIYYLKSVGAKFKHSRNEFLIEDHQQAMIVTLKYA